MNKETLIRVLTLIHKSHIFGYLAIAILFASIGMTYQAYKDEIILNNLFLSMSNHTTEKYITDGINVYSVYKYNTNFNFSSNEFLNKTQCKTLYGIGE